MQSSNAHLVSYEVSPPQTTALQRGLQRFTLSTIVMTITCALAILLLILYGHASPISALAQPEPRLMPGAFFAPDYACLSLHDGDFRCRISDDITIIYSGGSGHIRYTMQYRIDHTLGDLMVLWGSPDNYYYSGYVIIVSWNNHNASAYIDGCELRANATIGQIEYGRYRARARQWRGLIGDVSDCEQL